MDRFKPIFNAEMRQQTGIRCPLSGFEFDYMFSKLSELEKHLKECPLNRRDYVSS